MTHRIIGYLVALALVLVTLHQVDGWIGRDDTETTSASNAALALHPALLRYRAKLRAIEVRHTVVMDVHQASADSARAGADTADPSPWRTVAAHLDTVARACRVVLLACAERAANAEAELDTLHRRLSAQVQVRDHPWGVYAGGGLGFDGRATRWTIQIGLGRRLLRLPRIPLF